MKTICLSMIVKNESKIIARMLQSVRPVIDDFCIVDTRRSGTTWNGRGRASFPRCATPPKPFNKINLKCMKRAISQKECKENLRGYTKRSRGPKFIPAMYGLKGTKKNKTYLVHASEFFDKNPKKAWFDAAETKLPKGFNPGKPPESVVKSMCNEPRPRLKAIDLQQWIKHPLVRSKGLTIADIASMKKGERLAVVTIDRNVGDMVSALKPNTLYSASKALASSRATYEHRGGLAGILTLYAKSDDPVVLDPFEFHVEYAPGSWYPLEKGVLPAKDPQMNRPLLGKKTRWQDMPPSTRVGYRGSLLPESSLASLPKFYMYDPWP